MHESLRSIVTQMSDCTRLYERSLLGLDHDALLTRPGPRSNPLLWVAGHLTQARTRLLGALGPPRQVPWSDLFATGSIIGDLRQYPTAGELEAVWRSASTELLNRLAAVDERRLAAPAPEWLTSHDGSLFGGLGYAALHEAYHVGQMGYLRKWLGFDPILDA